MGPSTRSAQRRTARSRRTVIAYRVIDTVAGLEAACAALQSGTGPVAVDVERASGFRYSAKAYLVQVFRRGAGVFLFDPPAIGDMSPLQRAIGDAEWVFHAASQDLPSLNELGLMPPTIFDTELSARLLGWPRVGLGAVVERTLGIVLKKEHSAADWSTRPLPQDWLEYAALDVEHLVDVRDIVAEELDATGKREWAEEEFEEVRTRAPKPLPAEPWRRVTGVSRLRGRRNLAIARALWLARDRVARERDVAPGRLFPDRSLLAAVAAQPSSQGALSGVKAFTGRASRTDLAVWWAAFEEGRTTTDLPAERVPSDALPPVKAWAGRRPEADARLKTARPAVEAHAEFLSIPTENLLTPELLRRVAWEPPQAASAEAIAAALAALGARPWQVAQAAPVIARAFVRAAQAETDASEAGS
ncbi:HRDC domain-containing protein [Microbacterium excoecariae]|uniref:HRDC domain-containing protein n=1 Tax=Microbacterium excoecariae TaxID=2715210 RepID=UPI00140E356F|nr:HRDC domain-containing protein [Microbacterium excoecariae]NHI17162.1 ribonuclease D [Microbacterium excoecariae]